MPAPKKDASVRARRNKTAGRATISAREGVEVPPLPAGREWHPQTEAWWADVWSSPMAAEWDESDRGNVTMAALIYNDMWDAETAKERKDAAAEFRLQRVDLGLSPYARRRLEWTIASAGEATERTKRRREQAPSAPVGGVDPRSALRAVK